MVNRALQRVPGTLQFVEHLPSSQPKAVLVFRWRARGVTGRSGVHRARQRARPLWLVGQATPGKGLVFQISPQRAQRSGADRAHDSLDGLCSSTGQTQFTKHDAIAEHITSQSFSFSCLPAPRRSRERGLSSLRAAGRWLPDAVCGALPGPASPGTCLPPLCQWRGCGRGSSPARPL